MSSRKSGCARFEDALSELLDASKLSSHADILYRGTTIVATMHLSYFIYIYSQFCLIFSWNMYRFVGEIMPRSHIFRSWGGHVFVLFLLFFIIVSPRLLKYILPLSCSQLLSVLSETEVEALTLAMQRFRIVRATPMGWALFSRLQYFRSISYSHVKIFIIERRRMVGRWVDVEGKGPGIVVEYNKVIPPLIIRKYVSCFLKKYPMMRAIYMKEMLIMLIMITICYFLFFIQIIRCVKLWVF